MNFQIRKIQFVYRSLSYIIMDPVFLRMRFHLMVNSFFI